VPNPYTPGSHTPDSSPTTPSAKKDAKSGTIGKHQIKPFISTLTKLLKAKEIHQAEAIATTTGNTLDKIITYPSMNHKTQPINPSRLWSASKRSMGQGNTPHLHTSSTNTSTIENAITHALDTLAINHQ